MTDTEIPVDPPENEAEAQRTGGSEGPKKPPPPPVEPGEG